MSAAYACFQGPLNPFAGRSLPPIPGPGPETWKRFPLSFLLLATIATLASPGALGPPVRITVGRPFAPAAAGTARSAARAAIRARTVRIGSRRRPR